MQHQVVPVKRALAFVALLLFLVPTVAADHVFSHRAIVTGRVLGSDGVPVAGAAVNVTFDGVDIGGPCFDSRDEATGPHGDFTLCRHTHAMPANEVTVTVKVLGHETTAVFDKELRRTAVRVTLPMATPADHRDLGGERSFNRSLLVAGRFFNIGDTTVENVPVNGTPLAGQPILVRIVTENGILIVEKNATTNEFGDYRAAFDDARELPANTTVRIETTVGSRQQPLDMTFRRADIDIVLRPEPQEPLPDRPGTKPVPALGSLATVLVALTLVALRRRVRA